MYALGHGGPLKVLADAGSVGESSLRRYLVQFASSVIQFLRPVYMPATPFSASDLAAVQGQFASRRGFQGVTLAVDGSHIPFRPKNRETIMDYRNFKGWTSILAVAFVDSFYRFFDVWMWDTLGELEITPSLYEACLWLQLLNIPTNGLGRVASFSGTLVRVTTIMSSSTRITLQPNPKSAGSISAIRQQDSLWNKLLGSGRVAFDS